MRELVVGLCGLAAGVGTGRQVFVADWSRRPFLLEHGVKLIAFYMPTLSGRSAGGGGLAIAGIGQGLHGQALLVRTPADFCDAITGVFNNSFWKTCSIL